VGTRKDLVAFREERKLTQDQMAELLSMSRSYYCELELGTKTPSLEALGRMVLVFGHQVVGFFLPLSVAPSNKEDSPSDT